MKRRIWTAAAGLASVAAVIAAPSALAAFTTSKLEVQQTATATTFTLTQSSSDDPMASLRIVVPAGTTLTTTQAAGTVLGQATALLRLHGLADAEVPVNGNVVVANPGQVSAETQQRCLQGATPLATWVLAVTIAGNPVSVPVWVVQTSGPLAALGPAYVAACFTSPYLTLEQGGLPGQPQIVNAEFSVQGVFSRVSLGAFVALLTPWTVGTATPNTAATVAAPAAVAPGAVSISARKAGRGAIVSGRVTQAAQARGDASVAIFGGPRANRVKRLGRVQVRSNGTYTFRARTGIFFRANAVAAPASAPPLCTQLAPLQALGISCVNPTVNGFVVQSRVVRRR